MAAFRAGRGAAAAIGAVMTLAKLPAGASLRNGRERRCVQRETAMSARITQVTTHDVRVPTGADEVELEIHLAGAETVIVARRRDLRHHTRGDCVTVAG